jgi:hypothetical protein
MKKMIFTAVFAFLGFMAFAQNESGFGVKGGLNYSANGDYFDSARNAFENPDRNVGYHVGIFGKIGDKIYLRPELMYTKTKSDYRDSTFDMSKIDAPILVGLNIIGPLNVFAGPALQYILDTDIDGVRLDDVKNDFSVGLHIGVGLDLGRLGLDLRYERGFSENEVSVLSSNDGTFISGDRFDTRPDQLILSLSIKL